MFADCSLEKMYSLIVRRKNLEKIIIQLCSQYIRRKDLYYQKYSPSVRRKDLVLHAYSFIVRSNNLAYVTKKIQNFNTFADCSRDKMYSLIVCRKNLEKLSYSFVRRLFAERTLKILPFTDSSTLEFLKTRINNQTLFCVNCLHKTTQ